MRISSRCSTVRIVKEPKAVPGEGASEAYIHSMLHGAIIEKPKGKTLVRSFERALVLMREDEKKRGEVSPSPGLLRRPPSPAAG